VPAYHPDRHTGRDSADIQQRPCPVYPATGQPGRRVQDSCNLEAQTEELVNICTTLFCAVYWTVSKINTKSGGRPPSFSLEYSTFLMSAGLPRSLTHAYFLLSRSKTILLQQSFFVLI